MTLVEIERERQAELTAGHEHAEMVQTGRWPAVHKTIRVKSCSPGCPYTDEVNERYDQMIAELVVRA